MRPIAAACSTRCRFAPNFSVRDALNAHKIVLVQGAVAKIERVWAPGGPVEAESSDEVEENPESKGSRKANESAEVTV